MTMLCWRTARDQPESVSSYAPSESFLTYINPLGRPRRTALVAVMVVLTVFFAFAFQPGTASAQSGFAVNRFNPAERGSDWFWAESLDLRGHNRIAIGLVGDWAYKPLVAYDAQGDELAPLIRHQIYAHLGASYVLGDRIRFGLSVPILAYQEGQDVVLEGTAYPSPSAGALGDVRMGADLRLFGKYGGIVTGAIGAQVHLPTGNQDNYASDGATRISPRAALAGDIGIFTYAFKTGVNVRFNGDNFADQALGSEWSMGGALGLRLAQRKLTIGPEVWGATVFSDGAEGFFKEGGTPLEGVFGAHYRLGKQWLLGAGVGPGLTRGLGAPKVRTLISLDWAPLPREEAPLPVDTDGDGIFDPEDKCPLVPGPANDEPSKHGCPEAPLDSDQDGIIDAEDACPEQAGSASDDPEKHGCPPPEDADGDGIFDDQDACPTEAGNPNDDPQKHGCPPRDNDGDGILNEQDACPDEAGVPSDEPEKHGCPQAKIEGGQVKILDRIEFDTSKATLRESSLPILEAVLEILREHPEIAKLRIEGHTDNRGAVWFNTNLSRKRAAAVRKWLVEAGIDSARLTSVGLGPDDPIDDNATEEGRQNNRRVEFHIVGGDQSVVSDGEEQ